MSRFRRPKLRGKKRKVTENCGLEQHLVSTNYSAMYADLYGTVKKQGAITSSPRSRHRLVRATMYRRAQLEVVTSELRYMPSFFGGIPEGKLYDHTTGGN